MAYNYDLCKSCTYFRPSQKTLESSIPKHCDNLFLRDLFGLPDGFPSGIQIIHCECFSQFPIDFGDVKVLLDEKTNQGVSYILTQPRNFKLVRVPQLYDNSKNIKTLKI